MENYLPGGYTKQRSNRICDFDVENLSEVDKHDCMQKMAEFDEAHQEPLLTQIYGT